MPVAISRSIEFKFLGLGRRKPTRRGLEMEGNSGRSDCAARFRRSSCGNSVLRPQAGKRKGRLYDKKTEVKKESKPAADKSG